jgi:hypothetical protein
VEHGIGAAKLEICYDVTEDIYLDIHTVSSLMQATKETVSRRYHSTKLTRRPRLGENSSMSLCYDLIDENNTPFKRRSKASLSLSTTFFPQLVLYGFVFPGKGSLGLLHQFSRQGVCARDMPRGSAVFVV